MKNLYKRALSLVMAVVMLFSCMSVAFAKESENNNNQVVFAQQDPDKVAPHIVRMEVAPFSAGQTFTGEFKVNLLQWNYIPYFQVTNISNSNIYVAIYDKDNNRKVGMTLTGNGLFKLADKLSSGTYRYEIIVRNATPSGMIYLRAKT